MEHIIIKGGYKLKGTVKIEGSKNVTLPILAATLLAEDGTTVLKNVPILSDVHAMNQILRNLNVTVDFNEKINEVTVDATKNVGFDAGYEFVSQVRASILVMGALLARNGHAKVALPGGCAIGERPIDLHLKAFKALGAIVTQKNGYVEAFAKELIGNDIHLEFPSLGTTENIMIAAVKAKGNTTIKNAAQDPETIELASILNKMGAKITGAGTDVIQIKGVKRLKGVNFNIIQDRHEAGTFMIAAAMTEGDVLIKEAKIAQNIPVISKLVAMGANIQEEIGGVRVIGSKTINAVDVQAKPHPGFPTDMQAQITAILTVAKGESVITETVFEKRFQHLTEMAKMNVECKISGNVAVIKGGEVVGADVEASNLRGAAALILVGLRARGVTRVKNLEFLDRGYYNFHGKLKKLGASIERVKIPSDRVELYQEKIFSFSNVTQRIIPHPLGV